MAAGARIVHIVVALTPGTRIGPYEIGAKIGAGGMGEVYRATDTKLRRQVAVKILPAALATDPDRLARFQREAEVLASLNHPNIAAVHGLEEAAPSTGSGHAAIKALVMELVEGPTLADRIAQGPVPVGEALPIAKQIAEALEAAHEQGVVHRDLKPASIKVRLDGVVKVLDFGLAKAMEPTGVVSPSMSMAPTITTPALMTDAGMILGTAAYMSPEQARGKPVDRRADIWAFGCVLYEMLTGRRSFDGDDVAVTLGAVIHKEPDWRALPATTPASIRRLLARCLTKDPKGRIADASTARLEIVEATTASGSEAPAPAADSAPVPQSPWRRAAPIVAAVAVTGIATGLGTWTMVRPPSPRPVHLTMAHPVPEFVGGTNSDGNLALSPDGRFIAYVASTSSAVTSSTLPLYVRALDAPESRLLSNAARAPFFSPDGQWVGFVEANSRLSKVALTGGPSVPIADVGGVFRGASWGPDDAIVFATADPSKGVSRISAAGGNGTLRAVGFDLARRREISRGEGSWRRRVGTAQRRPQLGRGVEAARAWELTGSRGAGVRTRESILGLHNVNARPLHRPDTSPR
jgi:serine/threonine-protein kinase